MSPVTGWGFTLALPPDWDVMDLAPETAEASAQRRVARAVRRSPALGRHRAELTAVMASAVRQSQDSGVRLAAGWSGLHRGQVPVCAGLVVHVLDQAVTTAQELARALDDDADAAADRTTTVVTLDDGTQAVRLTETRSVVVDRRARTAVPTAVTRYYVVEPTTRSSMALLTYTSPVGAHVPVVGKVFARSAQSFTFRSPS